MGKSNGTGTFVFLLLLSLVASPQTARRHAAISIFRLATCRNDYARFCNSRAAWVWARRRTEAGMELSLPRRTLASLPCANDDGDVIDWLESDMRRLARAFDDRHGTDRFQRLIETAEDLITVDLDF